MSFYLSQCRRRGLGVVVEGGSANYWDPAVRKEARCPAHECVAKVFVFLSSIIICQWYKSN